MGAGCLVMPVELAEVNASIRDADDAIERLVGIRDALLQEQARLASDLPQTPRQCLEALRAHAVARVKAGRDVEYVVGEHLTTACRRDSESWFWLVTRNSYESKRTMEEVIAEIAEATMFAENVEKGLEGR